MRGLHTLLEVVVFAVVAARRQRHSHAANR
jgi:hypothetical protein